MREQQPDLIVLDLRMPGLDGFDALDELKNAPETAAIPVVVQTGMTLSPAERDRLAPAVAILDKRADGSERLTAVVKQLLSASADRRGGGVGNRVAQDGELLVGEGQPRRAARPAAEPELVERRLEVLH